METLTEYNTDEYMTTKDAEAVFGRPALEINTLLRAVSIERAACLKRPGQKGRPSNLYRRQDMAKLMRYLDAFSIED